MVDSWENHLYIEVYQGFNGEHIYKFHVRSFLIMLNPMKFP